MKHPLLQTRAVRLAALTLFSAMTSLSAVEPAPPAIRLLETNRPLVIGHRGLCELAPENTLPSFKLALDAAADMVELDYYHSRDGVMIVLHDPTLDRTTDATNRWGGKKISVEGKTAAEIQQLDAGSWFDPKFAKTKVPRLTEALDLIQGGGGVTLIERKGGDAGTCADLLVERKLINRVVVQSFDWQYLKEFHKIQPAQVLGALGPPKVLADGTKPVNRPKTLDATWLDLLLASGAKAVVWNQDITKESVEQAHQRGLKVWIYTINDSATANKLLDLGVDGLITNNTTRIKQIVALRAGT